jgi:hypothetical protein
MNFVFACGKVLVAAEAATDYRSSARTGSVF